MIPRRARADKKRKQDHAVCLRKAATDGTGVCLWQAAGGLYACVCPWPQSHEYIVNGGVYVLECIYVCAYVKRALKRFILAETLVQNGTGGGMSPPASTRISAG